MLTKTELCQPVDQFRVANAKAENPSLRPIKTGTSNGNALIKIFYKMFYQGGARSGNVWIPNFRMQLSACNKRMKQLLFLIVLFQSVKIQQVVNAKSMRRCYKTIHRNFRL